MLLDSIGLAAVDPSMQEVLIGAIAMVISAVFGSVYAAWAGRRTQERLLEKQIELNKQMHKQLMEEHQAFQRQMEDERRSYERSAEFHRESRERANDLAKEARQRAQNS